MNNQLISTTATLATAALLLTAVSCKDTPNSNANPQPEPTGSLRVSAPFANQTTNFAFDFFRQLNAAEGREKNVFVSPLSLHMALGMVLNGAREQTAQEIQRTLKLDAQTLTEANQTYANLLAALPKADPKVALTIANSVWHRQDFAVNESFRNTLQQLFGATVQAEPFNAATVGKINGWASQQTNGRIPKVLEQIQENERLFLLNAVYFKGDWKYQFDPQKTINAPFTLANGQQKSVRMMRLEANNLRRAFRQTYTAFELPYGDGKFVMTVLRPANTTNADAVMQAMTGNEWTQLQAELQAGKIDLGLPKFTLKYEADLRETLTKLGMPTAFTEQANFSGISNRRDLYLTKVKQNTFVAVDEKGTEAAAVTTVGVGVTSFQEPVLCDRPFVVMIHEKTSGTVLFMGKIANPQIEG